MTKRALIIFARDPVPGEVKTRLARHIGNQAAADLYAAMLQDVVQTASNLPKITPIIFWANSAVTQSMERLGERFISSLQNGNSLGERMAHAFDKVFSKDFKTCCIIGSDAPDIPQKYILQAFALLESNSVDVVFGPAADGGYYLVGMNRTYRQLFEDIPWSCQDTLEKSCAKAATLGISYALLPEWHDMDTLEDVTLALHMGLSTASKTHKALEHLLAHIFRNEGVIRA